MSAGGSAGTDTIRIAGLRLPFFIGVFDAERNARQGVVIDVEMRVPAAVRLGGSYVSYAPVVDYAAALSEGAEHIALVETLAERILGKALEDSRVIAARVSVMKTDIYPMAEGVGITIEGRQTEAAQ